MGVEAALTRLNWHHLFSTETLAASAIVTILDAKRLQKRANGMVYE